MHRVVFLILLVQVVKLMAIVPPKVPGLSLPEEMLTNIQRDPGFYVPGTAFSKRMRYYRQQKLRQNISRDIATDPVVGYLPVLCLQYADVDSEWPISQMADQLFDTNSDWPTGSMTDYYEEISYGAFSVTGDIYGWIQMSGDSEYYERENGHTYELIIEALTISDMDIDFSQYDTDGPDGIPNSGDDDGVVDELVLIHSGTGGEYGGPEIWSHSWTLQAAGGTAFTTNDVSADGDNILVNGYVIQPAVRPNGQMEEIGVFCHEYGHALGLPDLYDRDQSSEGVGNWALMAGSGSDGSRPSHMCAWSKEIMGWITPVVLTENSYNRQIPAVEDTAVVYKIWTHGEIKPYEYVDIWDDIYIEVGREYFLVENRQQKKFDNELPGEGLLIWHVQNDVTTQNDDESNKLVDLEEADYFFDLDMGRNRGDEGDPFPGEELNYNFERTSSPNSNVHGGGFSKVAIRNISAPHDTMVADLLVVAEDLMYYNNYVDDYSGDGNGYADPGDSVYLQLEFLNLGADIPFFEWTISSDDPTITILDSQAVITEIFEDSIRSSSPGDLHFLVSPDAPYHPILFSITGTNGANHTEDYQVTVMMENLKILLVDDSGGESDEFGVPLLTYFENAFIEADIAYYSLWEIHNSGIPEVSELNKYRTVVWLTGSNYNTLNITEQSRLTDFLENGGSLLLSGQNIGYDLVANGSSADAQFFADFLHAQFKFDDPGIGSNILMRGVESDPISNSYSPYFFLSGGNGANNQTSPDIIDTLNGATGTMEYFGTSVMGEKSGIKYAGDYRLVYYSFGIEGINELSSPVITRSNLLRRTIGWLQEDPTILATNGEPVSIVPQQFSLFQNYPNPFNPVTAIRFSLPQRTDVRLTIYDLLGKEIITLTDKNLSPGNHSYIWNGINTSGRSVSSGIYLYRLDAGKFTSTRKMMFLK